MRIPVKTSKINAFIQKSGGSPKDVVPIAVFLLIYAILNQYFGVEMKDEVLGAVGLGIAACSISLRRRKKKPKKPKKNTVGAK